MAAVNESAIEGLFEDFDSMLAFLMMIFGVVLSRRVANFVSAIFIIILLFVGGFCESNPDPSKLEMLRVFQEYFHEIFDGLMSFVYSMHSRLYRNV